MNGNSTPKRRRRKSSIRPAKPYSRFELYAHPSGHWAKKIRGKLHYFGRWGRVRDGVLELLPGETWQDAINCYKLQADDLHAGRTPRTATDGLTVAELCNRFLTAKTRQLEAEELSPRSFYEYKQATDLLVAKFGKGRLVDDLSPDDFESLRAFMARKWGPARLAKFVQMIRTAFGYGAKNGLLTRPVTFGSGFNKPGKAVLRKHKAASAKKLFAKNEVRMLLDALEGKAVAVEKKGKPVKVIRLAPNVQLRAAVLLGINAGLGNHDVADIEHKHLDLQRGWLDFPRVKTGLPRRVPLWPETIAAIKLAASRRPKPRVEADADCVFLNRGRHRLIVSTTTSHRDDLTVAFSKLLRELGINGRKGIGFYSLRHTFATIGLQAGDRDAVRSLMGHAAHDMLSAYDETGPSEARLRAVAEHVHGWLFAAEGGA